ncbi:MAG: 50S ribosomal protein L5 [Candidatus Pacebacteria bacterium]|nr:50S ribosomal protein L5 [Candidatus Paceibacterota bacterium]
MKHNTAKQKQTGLFEAMKGKFGYKNMLQAPRIEKVILSSTTGSVKDPKRKALIGDRINKIAGQKATVKSAKKSVASFKVRQGDPVGWQVTLRGERMWSFLEKLVNIALPRTRDFRGIELKSIDAMGNYTLGIKEHTVFPETSDEDIKDVFGFAVTIVTTSKTKAETEEVMKELGFLFKKIDTVK